MANNAKQQDISLPREGMNRATSQHQLTQTSYAFQLNGNSYDESGDKYNLTDEHSNILAVKFKEGFKYIGGKNHVIRGLTYVFLTNPTTKVSEIGYITNVKNTVEVADEEEVEVSDCEGCPKDINKEAAPLEDIEQVPHQEYVTMLEDSCNLCLGFNIEHPIVDIVIKEQNIGSKMFWTASPGNKEPRFLELDNLQQYKKTGDDHCGTEPKDTCLDCEKLRVFRHYKELQADKAVRVLGGNLKKGTYVILGAYCDDLGNEFTSYKELTSAIPIFDEGNIIHEQVDNNAETSFAIKVEMTTVDTRFDFYKVAVRYYTSLGVYTTFVESVRGITNKTIILSDNNGRTISETKLQLKKPFIERVDGMTSANNILMLNGVKEREPINLQPIASLLGLCVKWMSFRAKEDLYAHADSYAFAGYNRDENVLLSVDFGFKEGYRTNPFVLIPRPATEEEEAQVKDTDDYQSITDVVGTCDGNLRTKKWQFYNTATMEGICTASENTPTVEQKEQTAVYTTVLMPDVPRGYITIEEDEVDAFLNLEDYIDENRDDTDLLGSIAPYLEVGELHTEPVESEGECTDFELEDSESIVLVEEVKGESITYEYPDTAKDYESIYAPRNPQIYEVSGDKSKVDIDFSLAYFCGISETHMRLHSRKRVKNSRNTKFSRAKQLVNISKKEIQSAHGSFHHQNLGGLSLNEILDTNVTMGVVEGGFADKRHKGALWFKTKIKGRNKYYINISEKSEEKVEWIKTGREGIKYGKGKPTKVRVSFFKAEEDTLPIHSEIIDLKKDDNFIVVDKDVTNSNIIGTVENAGLDTIYISVEAPYRSAKGFGPTWEEDGAVTDNNDQLRTTGLVDYVETKLLDLPCGAWNIVERDEEPNKAKVWWDKISITKREKYTNTCTYKIPVLQDCNPVPYQYGTLGYSESTEKYPDNEELFDSTNLKITKSDITSKVLKEGLKLYTEKEDGGEIVLSDDANFICQNIRQFKLPDNKISSFINTTSVATGSDSIISPLGFTIDKEAVLNLLEVAVKNKLLTTEQKDNIVDFKIYRADSTLDRSIVASGLVFNTKTYETGETTKKDDESVAEEITYFNYPFNSLGRDKYYKNNPSTKDTEFDKMQIISPELDYFKPSIPKELSLQGFIFGKSNSRILPVENHAKMVILGSKARKLAKTLALLETLAETALNLASAAEAYRFDAGLVFSANPVGISLNILLAGVEVAGGVMFRYGRYKLEWEKSFENLGTPYNFGYYTASGSKYNYMKTSQVEGDQLRGISTGKYLKRGMLSIADTTTGERIKINNIDREDSTFLTLGNYPIKDLDGGYVNFDNSTTAAYSSSQLLSSETGNEKGKSSEKIRNIASPYVALKNYIPNQYGALESIKWIDTMYQTDLNKSPCKGILGGDTFITRHSKKRKVRLFNTDLLGSADFTPFPYGFYGNYGREPRFYIDYKDTGEESQKGTTFPSIIFNTHFDGNTSSNKFYIKPPAKFYLYSISFVNFLCETRINTSFRNARKEPWHQFYPQNSDYEELTQPNTVKLTRDEHFFYNKAYLQISGKDNPFMLPRYYSKEMTKKKAYNRNSIMYSLPDANENSITEPWLMYKPNDKATLESTYGELINIKGIESGQILMYFENALQLQNATNKFTDGSTQYNSDLGNGGIFAKRALTMKTTDIGYGGSQSKQTLSCEFGHFHLDIIRGQVFKFTGNKLEEISRYSGGNPNGMDVWFKEHLPLKIVKHFPKYTKLDNPYNGVGIHWGYDSKYRRILLTKKDYIPKKGVKLVYDEVTNLFSGETLQEQIKQGNLEDISWTITYRPESGTWESYMSYKPNYYLNHTDYFQSGVNSEDETNGLWSHLLTNKSYRVFYGKAYPYILEYPIKNQYISKAVEGISWNAQLRRHHNEYDFAPIETNPFTRVTIYNDYENTGNLIPIKNTGSLRQLSKYPITKSSTSQEVLLSYDNYRYKLNYLYNRVVGNKNNLPIWIWDKNQIEKKINPKAVSFYGKRTLERLRGNFFMVRLERDRDTNYDLDFRWAEQTINPKL